jgi:DNA-binding transcriptional LysR family regulator
MNLRQLEILRAVMRCGTTVDAARELGMSQPAVSNAVKHAEAQLGFVLFDRLSNRLIPTEEAKALLAEAEPLFSIHEAVLRTAADLRSRKRGRIRIIATAELSAPLISRVLKRFLDRNPEVEVTLDTRPLGGVIEAVELGTFDVGIAIEPYGRPGLNFTPLTQLKLVCICPPGSPLARLDVVTPKDLAGIRLVGMHTTSRLKNLIEDAFRRRGETFQPNIEVRFLNICAALVADGIGAAIVDELTARSQAGSPFVVRPFEPAIAVAVAAIALKDRPQSRLVRAFMEELSSTLALHER